MKVIQADADGGVPRKIVAPQARDGITFVQFQSLLSALNAVAAFVTNNRGMDDASPAGGALDGGVKAAAEVSFMKLCDRLDKMVDDHSRWSMDTQDSLESKLMEVYQAQHILLTDQKDAVRLMRAPQTRLHPTLVKLDNDTWAAIYGDPANEVTSIIGTGASPEDALTNFDQVFEGKINEQKTKKSMDGRGVIIPGGEPVQTVGAPDRKATRKVARIRRTPKKKAAPRRKLNVGPGI